MSYKPRLSYALSQIKDVLGQKIDLVGMDACLMAMVEVAYEIKDYVNILVASQETEPGYWMGLCRYC